jgi:hypothetical protein
MPLLPLPIRLGFALSAAPLAVSVSGLALRQAGPATLALRFLGRLRRSVPSDYQLWWPSETEHLKQIKAVLFLPVPAPAVFADLPAHAFGQGTPAQKRQASTFFYITSAHVYSRQHLFTFSD